MARPFSFIFGSEKTHPNIKEKRSGHARLAKSLAKCKIHLLIMDITTACSSKHLTLNLTQAKHNIKHCLQRNLQDAVVGINFSCLFLELILQLVRMDFFIVEL